MTQEINNKYVNEDDEIDLLALAKSMWEKRKFILKTIGVFAVAGVIMALTSPVRYTATTTMVPQLSGESSRMGNISSLASMAGINLNLGQKATDLSPQTYPKIVQSVPFQLKIMETQFQFSDVEKPVSLFDYYTQYSKPGPLSVIKKYTLGLPGILLKAFKGKQKEQTLPPLPGEEKAIRLSKEQDEVRKIIAENIQLELNDKEGYLQLNTHFHDAPLAAQVASEAQTLLQEYITRFKVEKARAQLDFVKERHNEKKKAFEQAQANLAAFRDRNKNVTSAMALTEQERLQNEYQLAFEVYSSIAQQLEQARIKVKEDTPVFSVIQPVTIPSERSEPKRKIILAIWIFLGIALAAGWVLAQQYLANARQRWHEIDTSNGIHSPFPENPPQKEKNAKQTIQYS